MTQSVPTFCRICEPSCGLLADVENGAVTRLRPNKAHPVTKGFACHKGINFLDVHNDPDRLGFPLKRQNSRAELPASFAQTDWDSAIGEIASKLTAIRGRYGDKSIAGYMGNPMAFNSTGQLEIPGFFKGLNGRFFSALTQDCANKLAASEVIYGSGNLHPVPDLDNTDYFLCLGENPRVSHMSFYSVADPISLLRGVISRGGRVIYVNPRKIESVSPATGEWQPIRPDSDLYFLAALLNTIDAAGGFDEQVIARHGKNIEGLRRFIQPYTAEAVAELTAIPAAQIRQIAQDWMAAPRASVHMSTGVNMGRQGSLCYWLVQMLSFVTGNLGREGGNIYSRGFYPSTQFGALRNSEGFNPWQQSAQGEFREVAGNLPGNLLADYIHDEQQPIRALIVVGGNPLLSVGGEVRLREAFPKLELLVVIDIYRSATAEYADYLLPATDWLEREDINMTGVGMQSQPFVHYTEAVVAARDQRKPEWWILAAINQAMGLPSLLDADEPQPLRKIDGLLAMAGLTRQTLLEKSAQTQVCDVPAPELLFSEGLQFADQRVDCAPALFEPAFDEARKIFEESTADTQLRLINLRTPYMHNSWFQNVQKLKRPAHQRNPLHISPADAERLNLSDEQTVKVSNQWGEITAEIKLDDSLHTGAVAMTHGWGNQRSFGLSVAQQYPGVNVNQLLPTGPGSYEKLSNQAFMSGVPVQVEALA
ncbi:molybdopterin-dependent oxidoreductase [Spongiibacter sp. KMU-158]|uniref:Molybdopterin-dependent oxidoreductase n=1 Tax=Spongiibacter pelagi TaxID=2760804 RepID=A0A927C412_9GAMM|nr:molybdopterin-dependent oxidoreductase [Spongiibacter pelagi]MBD2859612.1 molybdopterin-dependent oxidoreductase [Spongiibacter pelagi]